MSETPKKRAASSPKRSARKKFDIHIDPEVDAWSKKLFHPIKPIIDGLKEQAAQKLDPDFMSETDKLSRSNKELISDNLSDTDIYTVSDIKSDADNLSDTSINQASTLEKMFFDESDLRSFKEQFSRSNDRDQRSNDQHFDLKEPINTRSQSRSEVEIKSVPDFSSVMPMIESDRDIKSDTDNLSDTDTMSASLRVPFVRGELRIPNYILKGLLPVLSNSEFVVYLWLYFLSYGFGKNTCYVSAGKLAESVNLTDRTVFRALNSLETRGLLRRATRHFLGKAGGLTFEVFLPDTDKLSDSDLMSENIKMSDETTRALRSDTDKLSTIKDHDHDLKKITDHENRVMKVYYDLTSNIWTPSDHIQYLQIKDTPIETIETNMRIIASRSTDTVRSFAYFAKSLRNSAGLLGTKASSKVQRAKMREFIQEVMTAHVGGRLMVSELEEKVRRKCEISGVTFDKVVFNDLLSSRG